MCGFTQVVREGTLNGWCIQKATPAVQGVELDHRPRTFADGGRESATIEGPCFQLCALVCYPFRDLLWSEVCL